jgi:hypothetical protein
MIDKSARKRARNFLKKLALGRSTSYECENEFLDLCSNSDDPVIFALYRTISEMSGEFDKPLSHLFTRGGEMRKRVCRWIFFLQTDLEYEWPKVQLAPGIRDTYNPNWFDKILGLESRIVRSNQDFCSHGDYHMWPFISESDLNSVKAMCAQQRRALNSQSQT